MNSEVAFVGNGAIPIILSGQYTGVSTIAVSPNVAPTMATTTVPGPNSRLTPAPLSFKVWVQLVIRPLLRVMSPVWMNA